jgi:beta-lactamase regulating signal transducer with metallopeptidase domain
MSATFQHLSGEFLNLHPNVSGWILDAARTTAITLGAFGMAWLLVNRSAVARSWVIRMGFVTLAIAAVWQVVPSSYSRFRPSMRFDVAAPTPVESAPPTETSHPPEVMRDHPEQVTLATEAIPSALPGPKPFRTSEPETGSSQFSVVTWFEEKLAMVWAGGTLIITGWLLLRHFMGLIWLHRKGRPSSEEISSIVQETGTSLGVLRNPECRIVNPLSNPLMTGWRKAWIWLPEETLEMPVKHQQAIIAHEVVHFHRNDLPWQTCAALICAFWWWNPLVWLLLKRLKSEAELATDEFVVSGNALATDYAEALVKVAAGISSSPQRHIGVPMAGKSPVEQRVKAILADNPFRNRLGWIASVAVVILTLAGSFVASFSAIAQEKKPPSVVKTKPPETQQQLAERIVAMLNERHKRMNFLHLKVERTWSQTDDESDVPIAPPVSEKMEVWEDAESGKYRVEYRPRVSRWTNGAAPFHVEEETQINDGEYTFSQYESQGQQQPKKNSEKTSLGTEEARIGREYEKKALRLLSLIIRNDGSPGPFKRSISEKEIDGLSVAEIVEVCTVDAGKVAQRITIRLDLGSMGAIVLYRFESPSRSTEWKRLHSDNQPGVVSIPKEYVFTSERKGEKHVSNYRVVEFEVLKSLPYGITEIQNPKKDKFVANNGIATQRESILIKLSDAKTGIPIKDAKVEYQVNSTKESTGKIGTDGNVLIQLPKEEVMSLRVTCKSGDYVGHVLRVRKEGDPIQLPESYELKLHKASKISGKITTESGAPIQGALVEAYIFGPQKGSVLSDGFLLSGIEAKSNEEGIWTMEGFPDDLKGLSMRVSHADYIDTSDGPISGYLMLARQPYESLRDGSSRIVLKEGVAIEGKVLDYSGHPVKGCRVTIGEDNFQGASPVAVTDNGGIYRLSGLKSGETVVTFEGPAQHPAIHKITLPLANNKMDDVRLEQPRTLRGIVLSEDGAPIAGLYVNAQRWRGQRNLKFWTTTDSEGRFEWTAAPKDEVTFDLGVGQNREFLSDVSLIAGGEELRIVMKPALRVKISAVDDTTGKPIRKLRVTSGYGELKSPYWATDEARTASDVYEWKTNYFARREDLHHRFLVEAEGYEPHQTKSYPTNQQTETLQVRLKAK